MPTELGAAGLLQLLRLASPALPVGGFSYSEGLEAAVENGLVANEADARAWLVDQLHLGIGRSEAPVVKAAFEAFGSDDFERIEALNRWVLATRETSEMHLQAVQMGRSLVQWLLGEDDADERITRLRALAPAPTWPIAFALALQRADVPLHEGLLAFAFGWAENMVQSALRAVPLGQSAGQRLLGALAREIPAVVAQASALPDEDRQAFMPMLAIQSARHESQYSRLFRS